RAQPTEQKQRGRFESGSVIDRDVCDFPEVMVRRGVIEKLSDGVADLVEPCPIQIAEHDPLFCFLFRSFDEMHLRVEIFPSLAVENQSIDPGPKLRIHFLGEIVLPPEIERQVGIEMRKDDTGEKFRARTLEQKRDLFRANLLAACPRYMAVRVDPRV